MAYENFTELDFEERKASLRRFLESQSEFADYDFDGSAISTLMDLLAYNSLIDAYTVNMAANERFLSTAQRRASVAANAAGIGYTPSSSVGATASINVSVTPVDTNLQSFTIPAFTKFTSRAGNQSFTFYTTDNTIVTDDGSGQLTGTLNITEGKKFRHRYTVSRVREPQRIPNNNVDLSRMTVTVFDSESDQTGTTFTRMQSAVQVTSNARVYGVEERDDGNYYIVFGDGIVGERVDSGQIVVIDYLAVNGTDANGITRFTYADSIVGVDSLTITSTASRSAGGSGKESIESIKRRAPAFYQRQNRTVTEQDYRQVVSEIVPSVRDVATWGGEKNDPPAYGRVFISAVTNELTSLTSRQKTLITSTLDDLYNPAGLWPQIIDPQIKRVVVDARITFDPAIKDISQTGKSDAIEALEQLNDSTVGRFQQRLLFSQVVRALDEISPAVNGSFVDLRITISPQSTPILAAEQTISFGQEIDRATLTSNKFTYIGTENVFIADDPEGCRFAANDDDLADLNVYRQTQAGQLVVVVAEIGTIRYSTGQLQFTNTDVFTNSSLDTDTVTFTARPSQQDVIPTFNELIILDGSNSQITMVNQLTNVQTGDTT